MFIHNQPTPFRDLPKTAKVDDAVYKAAAAVIAILLLAGAALA